jgi:hypothetical protein
MTLVSEWFFVFLKPIEYSSHSSSTINTFLFAKDGYLSNKTLLKRWRLFFSFFTTKTNFCPNSKLVMEKSLNKDWIEWNGESL